MKFMGTLAMGMIRTATLFKMPPDVIGFDLAVLCFFILVMAVKPLFSTVFHNAENRFCTNVESISKPLFLMFKTWGHCVLKNSIPFYSGKNPVPDFASVYLGI